MKAVPTQHAALHAQPRAAGKHAAPKLCTTPTLHEHRWHEQQPYQDTPSDLQSRSRPSREQQGRTRRLAAGSMSAALQSREDERACGMQARVSLGVLQAAPALLSAPAIMRLWWEDDAERGAAPDQMRAWLPGAPTSTRPQRRLPPLVLQHFHQAISRSPCRSASWRR